MMDAHSSQLQNFQSQVLNLLHRERAIDPALICRKGDDDSQSSIPLQLSSIAACLESHGKLAESIALNEAVERITTAKEFGGLGTKDTASASYFTTESDFANAAFIVEALLLSLSAEAYSRNFLTTSLPPYRDTKPMTLAQKIFAQHLIGTATPAEVGAGTVVRVGLDWILSSELSWQVGIALMHGYWYVC